MTGDVEFLQSANGKVPRGWAAAQVATTADFSHGSWFWTQFSGGLNYQARPPSACLGTHDQETQPSLLRQPQSSAATAQSLPLSSSCMRMLGVLCQGSMAGPCHTCLVRVIRMPLLQRWGFPPITVHACGHALQVVHHLFPNVCHTHYPAIAPIVLATCAEFGVPYKVYPSVRAVYPVSVKLQGCRMQPACLCLSQCSS